MLVSNPSLTILEKIQSNPSRSTPPSLSLSSISSSLVRIGWGWNAYRIDYRWYSWFRWKHWQRICVSVNEVLPIWRERRVASSSVAREAIIIHRRLLSTTSIHSRSIHFNQSNYSTQQARAERLGGAIEANLALPITFLPSFLPLLVSKKSSVS